MKAGTTPPPDATVTVVLAVVCPPLTVMVYVPRLFGAGIEAVQLPEASVTFPVMTVPSLIVIVPKTCGMPPAARTPRAARSASSPIPALHGVIVLCPLATPTMGLRKSLASYPIA